MLVDNLVVIFEKPVGSVGAEDPVLRDLRESLSGGNEGCPEGLILIIKLNKDE